MMHPRRNSGIVASGSMVLLDAVSRASRATQKPKLTQTAVRDVMSFGPISGVPTTITPISNPSIHPDRNSLENQPDKHHPDIRIVGKNNRTKAETKMNVMVVADELAALSDIDTGRCNASLKNFVSIVENCIEYA
ncbi:uncharacterized protein BDR25DRAFT_318993 [Lindgomyces ingoldianus]|uniref:Uncharacterized protein n=1 Tax=Lindgomyces ingoldianus TaxID=673940 RepID=A0ACB6QCG5_9PLEO|nr:uncharacterized protein BDR25DRAFT_318993 [Lindgomyces ingoldianus]KAF2464729.1 hypothetical protein BDR25DRAFT_318993 [Lindgomyces ingoldianus]